MIIDDNNIAELARIYQFHQEEHRRLSLKFLEKTAEKIKFKLKLQKATIHLVQDHSFAVIGLRRSRKSIFIEFFTKEKIKNPRIIKTVTGKKGMIINRITIGKEEDIDLELTGYVIQSSSLIKT